MVFCWVIYTTKNLHIKIVGQDKNIFQAIQKVKKDPKESQLYSVQRNAILVNKDGKLDVERYLQCI